MIDRALRMVFENQTYRETMMLKELSDFEKSGILGDSVQKLYSTLLDKSRGKYDDIDKCKGDITKYEGYKNMIASLDAVENLVKNTRGVGDLGELKTVKLAISNIERNTNVFVTSYKLERDFGKLVFRMLVAACVESTSIIIASGIEFLKDSQAKTINLVRQYETKDHLPIHQLEKFNSSISSGEFLRVMSAVNSTNKEKLVGGALAVPFAILGAMIALIILLRELVFYFYYSRMQLSQYLDQQREFLEYNITALEYDRSMETTRKADIIKKQQKIVKNLEKLSDKIKVNNQMTAVQARDSVRKEKESFTLSDAKAGATATAISGNGFRIL